MFVHRMCAHTDSIVFLRLTTLGASYSMKNMSYEFVAVQVTIGHVGR